MLAALIDCPFVVINADDYCGKTAYRQRHDYLVADPDSTAYAMAGFILKNPLPYNGGVTRGIGACSDGFLTDVVETKGIIRTPEGAKAKDVSLDPSAYVSMNMWALTKEFVTLLEEGFEAFFREMREKRVSVRVLESANRWFGGTYQEERQTVMDEIAKLIARGEYPQDLYGDL